jgi:uncharacterized protein (TIGR02594 family)
MKGIEISAFDVAQRFVGLKEVSGSASNPQVLAMLRLDDVLVANDEVAWCSAFANYVAWLLRLPRSKSLRARSWLGIGVPVSPEAAEAGFDVVILKRGGPTEPGPEVLDAPGHVGFFAGREPDSLLVLGGNQKDAVNIQRFPAERLLGIRRLAG